MFLAFSLWYMFMPIEVLGFIMVGNYRVPHYRVPHYTILSRIVSATMILRQNNLIIIKTLWEKKSNHIQHDA